MRCTIPVGLRGVVVLAALMLGPTWVLAEEIMAVANKPLSRRNAEKPGAYELAVLVSNPIVDAGDRLEIEVYVSGYGNIETPKIAFYPSPATFDTKKSVVWHSLRRFPDSKLGWGAETAALDPTGAVISLSGGLSFDEASGKSTWVFDAHPSSEPHNFQISTEVKHPLGKSPICLDLALSPKPKPGPQGINFVLTYFDGQAWQTKTATAGFTVRNFYQRHETGVWILGTVLAVLLASISFATDGWALLCRLAGLAKGLRFR